MDTIFDWLDKKHLKYNDKKLIEEAFIHSSYVNENKLYKHDNERLEFMENAVLQPYVHSWFVRKHWLHIIDSWGCGIIFA